MKQIRLKIIWLLIAFLIFPWVTGCTHNASKKGNIDTSMYSYNDTKNLVSFVHDAALIAQNKGKNCISYFQNHRKQYHNSSFYLYVYDMNGTNLFHAGMPEIEGQNLSNLTDKDGKPVTQLILNALSNETNPHSWVHYSWWEENTFYPVQKSSCHFLVKTPEGDSLFVGGGMNYPHEEKEFVRIIVDDAVELIQNNPEHCFSILEDPTTEYNFREVRIFVFNEQGEMIIDPAVNVTFPLANVIECVDAVGHTPFSSAITNLKDKDTTWEIFMTKSLYSRKLVKKCMYIRKTSLDGKTLYVGAITDLPQPSY